MKLAVVTFHNGFSPNEVGGVSSAPIYLTQQLKKYFDDIDLLTLRNTKKHLSPIASDVQYVSDPKVLGDYDFVIFISPGLTYEKYDENDPDRYVDIMDCTKRFTFVFNEENDRKMYPYIMNFIKHPKVSFLTFCAHGMSKIFEDYIELVGDWEYLNFSPTLPSKEEVLEKARSKKDKIMSTCRWTTSKRIFEYLSMTDDFIKNGIEVYAAGAHQSYWYNLKMGELPSSNYTDLGYFEPSQVPELLSDVKYHWNFLFQVRGMGLRTHQPRLENATMEAIREGCLPVVCEEFTPDWLGFDSAVRLSKHNYTDIPSVLGKISDEERLERIGRLYDLVDEHIISHYKDIADHIKRVCS